MNLDSLRMLFVHELNDLYDAEHQLLNALPRMAKAASFLDLRMDFERHLGQTREHVRRLERAFSMIEEKPKRITCKGMKGLIEEGEEMMHADGAPAIKDAGLISTAQRMEHYEMARYGCARTYAETLGLAGAVEMLQQTLDEERSTDECLTELAERLIHGELVHVQHSEQWVSGLGEQVEEEGLEFRADIVRAIQNAG